MDSVEASTLWERLPLYIFCGTVRGGLESTRRSALPRIRLRWFLINVVFRYLIDMDADVNAYNNAGNTALHIAVTKEFPRTIAYLVNYIQKYHLDSSNVSIRITKKMLSSARNR